MISVKSDFREKCIDIQVLFDHINEIESAKSSSVHKVSILKSSFIILLYNTIESTTRLLLDKVHEEASKYDYDQLSEKLKILFVEYYFASQNGKNHKKNLDMIVIKSLTFPNFNEFENRIKTFSGNLDSREIDKILSKYGIGKITTENKEKLLIVKNIRNKIAHGEEMFKESCRHFTLSDIELIKSATEKVLNDIIHQTENYLSRNRHLKSER